jgi:hypothetical protein
MSSVGLAYIGAAFAPCDVGCPSPPTSARQLLHNVFGIVEYVGGGLGLLLFAGVTLDVDRIASPERPLCGPGCGRDRLRWDCDSALEAWHGAIQWVGEAALFGSLFLIGWRLARRQRAAGAA